MKANPDAENKNPTPELTLADLNATLIFIDTAVERGAVKGSEIMEVAVLRDRIVKYLRAQQK